MPSWTDIDRSDKATRVLEDGLKMLRAPPANRLLVREAYPFNVAVRLRFPAHRNWPHCL
jgi:hypothetical protein